MSERINPVARMTVPVKRRGRGRPPADKGRGLRERAWWLMRTRPAFTLDDLLLTLAEGAERDPASNLGRYIRGLERVGVLQRLQRRIPGRAPTSNGHVIWRLVRDLGRAAPLVRAAGVWDPNAGALLAWPAPATPASAPIAVEAAP